MNKLFGITLLSLLLLGCTQKYPPITDEEVRKATSAYFSSLQIDDAAMTEKSAVTAQWCVDIAHTGRTATRQELVNRVRSTYGKAGADASDADIDANALLNAKMHEVWTWQMAGTMTGDRRLQEFFLHCNSETRKIVQELK